MGCAPYTCCEISCGCCALGFGLPLFQCILISNRVGAGNGDDGGSNKIRPPVSTSETFNTDLCRLRQSAIDNKAFRTTVDSWTPRSLSDLIALLRAYTADKHPLDQAWIVFYWITQNMSYDVDSYLNNRIPDQDATAVFQSRKGVCEGFASLFLHLCAAIGLECVKVSGYAKGHGYAARGGKFDDTNHAWNAVKIGDFWYLIDSTWGEGSLNGNVTQKKLQPYYFLVRPEQLVYTHLPENKNWQLLADPITMEKFLSFPKPWPPFFEFNLELVDKSLSNIVPLKPNESFIEIALRCPSDVVLHCSIETKNQKVENGDLIQFDHGENLYKCLFAPQQSGWHQLNIFAKKKTTAGSYDSVMQFSTDIPKSIKPVAFPTTYGLFQKNKCCLYEPLSRILQKGSEVTYRCRIPSAKRVALILDGKKWIYDGQFSNETMNLTVTVLEKSVAINAQFDNADTNWSTLVKYTVE